MKPAYNVEPEGNNCTHCGRERYVVVGPDGVALGTSYYELADAEEEASSLNRAFANGAASDGKLRKTILAVARDNGLEWDTDSCSLQFNDEPYQSLEDALAVTFVNLLDLPEGGT